MSGANTAEPNDEVAGLASAQFQSFAGNMPVYYLSVIAMLLASAYVFYPLAPVWLSCGVPFLGTAVGVKRGIWWHTRRNEILSDEEARHHLRKATWTLVGAAFAAISMNVGLFQYADLHAKYFILFQILTCAMCGFFCLMHLRAAALSVATAVMVPFCGFMLRMHQASTTAAAATCVCAAIVMVIAMSKYQREFISQIRSRAATMKLSEDNLRLAHLDMLTGLSNRRHFFDALERMPKSIELTDPAVAVGILDLDGFKPVNDTYGHRVGDQVLAEIAARLREAAFGVEDLCRVGGDEFAFVVRNVPEKVDLMSLGQSLIGLVSQPLEIDQRTTSVGCSVGFALCTAGAIHPDVLYEQADYALYHAKRYERGSTILFSEEHETLLREQALVEQTLRNADFDAEFYPLFQPIVDARTGKVLAFECLARWKSAVLGNVSPGTFIPVAERAGLITELTPVLLRKALEVAKTWADDVHLSFNVSSHDVVNLDHTLRLISILKESGVGAHRVAVELTETALLENFSQTSTHLAMIRAVGVKISLDDFGTGHSSLTHIHALPLDKIKIDRSFIKDIDSNPASKSIVRSLIALCCDMELACIIEGVETESQLTVLRAFEGNIIQGYYFAKPMTAENIPGYMNRLSRGPAVLPVQKIATIARRSVPRPELDLEVPLRQQPHQDGRAANARSTKRNEPGRSESSRRRPSPPYLESA